MPPLPVRLLVVRTPTTPRLHDMNQAVPLLESSTTFVASRAVIRVSAAVAYDNQDDSSARTYEILVNLAGPETADRRFVGTETRFAPPPVPHATAEGTAGQVVDLNLAPLRRRNATKTKALAGSVRDTVRSRTTRPCPGRRGVRGRSPCRPASSRPGRLRRPRLAPVGSDSARASR